MFKNLLIKWKLAALVAILMVALLTGKSSNNKVSHYLAQQQSEAAFGLPFFR